MTETSSDGGLFKIEHFVQQLWEKSEHPYPTFEDTFDEIYGDALMLLIEKQRAYGPENVAQLGFHGVFSRLASDKVERLRNLMNGRVVRGQIELDWPDTFEESVEDTLVDILNYAAILIALYRGHWGFPLEDE